MNQIPWILPITPSIQFLVLFSLLAFFHSSVCTRSEATSTWIKATYPVPAPLGKRIGLTFALRNALRALIMSDTVILSDAVIVLRASFPPAYITFVPADITSRVITSID
ncbi:hypothetical protein D3C76_1613720 [compost metagenome]